MLKRERASPCGRGVKRILSVGGLALVLALLAHDALMAVAASALLAPHKAPLQFETDPAHHADFVGADNASLSPVPEHPKNCGTAGDAVPTAGPGRDAVGTSSRILEDDPWLSSHSVSPHWDEPCWPPGARRAWFQVYRI